VVKRTVGYLIHRVNLDEQNSGETWSSEEKCEKMQELAVQSLDHISSVIDTLKEEIEFYPQTMLGVAVFPTKLY